MGKQPQKLREALSNKACLSQVPAQELKKAPRTSICPTCNPWFQWHFSHLQPVRWIHFKLHSAAFTEVFLSFSARREEKSTLTSVLCAVWFHFFFISCQACGFFPPLSQVTINSLWYPWKGTASLSQSPQMRNGFNIYLQWQLQHRNRELLY